MDNYVVIIAVNYTVFLHSFYLCMLYMFMFIANAEMHVLVALQKEKIAK